MVVRWSFYDPTVPETYTFHVNPNQGGTPGIQKNITTEVTAAPDGSAIIFEGRAEPQAFEFSGVILEQAHLDAFLYWFQKEHQVRLTDDLGRQYWVYLKTFTPTRERKRTYPWYHSFSAEATILDVA